MLKPFSCAICDTESTTIFSGIIFYHPLQFPYEISLFSVYLFVAYLVVVVSVLPLCGFLRPPCY